jgi:hypothetical protein
MEFRIMEHGDMDSYLTNFPAVSIQTLICKQAEGKLNGATVVAVDDGLVCGMGGVVEKDGEFHVWMTAAPSLKKKPLTIYRTLSYAINGIDERPIYAEISANDAKTQRLAVMLGFENDGERSTNVRYVRHG